MKNYVSLRRLERVDPEDLDPPEPDYPEVRYNGIF